MSKAWTILLALTFSRMTMGFQFQSIPALADPLTASGEMSYAALGTLIGIYLLPGALVALAGGWLGARLGDARVASYGLALMALGGFGGWWVRDFDAALIFRLLAGVGAVGLNVLVTKMAADWFEARDDLATGMGVLVSSWPAGLAISAFTLPWVAASWGLQAALLLPAIFCALGWVALWLIWQEPDRNAASKQSTQTSGYESREIVLVILASLIWALYNVALVGVIAWLPGYLQSIGTQPLKAATSASFIGWAAIFSVAAGGWLASRLASKDLPTLACFAVSAGIIAMLPWGGMTAGSVWVMILLGLSVGPAAAMVMTLPIEAARAHLRATTMGIYFAIYYGLMGIGPVVLGALRDATSNPVAPIYAASGLLFLCLLMWVAFRRIQSAPFATSDK